MSDLPFPGEPTLGSAETKPATGPQNLREDLEHLLDRGRTGPGIDEVDRSVGCHPAC